jgi:hypothetical protein
VHRLKVAAVDAEVLEQFDMGHEDYPLMDGACAAGLSGRRRRIKGTSKNRLTSPDFVLSQHFSHNSYSFSILSSAIGTPKSLPMAGFSHARAGIPSLANQTRRLML